MSKGVDPMLLDPAFVMDRPLGHDVTHGMSVSALLSSVLGPLCRDRARFSCAKRRSSATRSAWARRSRRPRRCAIHAPAAAS
ncbi:hypothetical protein PQQ62_09980 [Caballeronia grimmiae]